MTALIHLPREVLDLVLTLLCPADIRRCQTVCRALHSLISTSPRLLCILTLDSLGYTIPTRQRQDISASDSLELLRRHRLHWDHPTSVQPDRYLLSPNRPGPRSKYIEGIYTQIIQGTGPPGSSDMIKGLRFYQLPSNNLGIGFREWAIDDLEASPRDFIIAPAQNLLVLIELPNTPQPRSCTVHFRSILTGKPHPRALVPTMTTRFVQDGGEEGTIPDWNFDLQVFDNLLAILFRSRSREVDSWVVVWDWHSGIEVTRVPTIGGWRASFALIDSSTLLLPRFSESFYGRAYTPNDTFGWLEVHTFDPHISHSTPPRLTASFGLPDLGNSYAGSMIRICPPSRSVLQGNQLPKLYEPGSDDHLICIEVHVCQCAGFSQIVEPFGTLYVPSRVLLGQHSQPKSNRSIIKALCGTFLAPFLAPPLVPWNNWAHYTSWMKFNESGLRHDCMMYGDRIGMVPSPPGSADSPNEILLLDFNTRRLRWETRTRYGSKTKDIMSNLGDGGPAGRKDALEEVFGESGLPSQMQYSQKILNIDGGIESVNDIFLDDERVVLVQQGRLGEGASLSVYTF